MPLYHLFLSSFKKSSTLKPFLLIFGTLRVVFRGIVAETGSIFSLKSYSGISNSGFSEFNFIKPRFSLFTIYFDSFLDKLL